MHNLQDANKHNSGSTSKPEYRFTFDFGPSWYWMPDLFDAIYDRFGGRKHSEFYERKLLDPAYRVFHKTSNKSEGSQKSGKILSVKKQNLNHFAHNFNSQFSKYIAYYF